MMNANCGISALIRDQHARNARTSQGRNDPGYQSRKSYFGDAATLARGQLGKNADLDTD
jgi:hypothetical protein